MTRRELTTEEKAEAARLTAAWERYKAENKGATQTWLAAEAGLGTQGSVSQYMRAVIALNVEALMAMCRVIGADPREISPRLTSKIHLPGMSPETQGDDSPFIEPPAEMAGLRLVRVGENADVVPIPRVKLRLRAGVANFDTEPDMNGDGQEQIPRAVLNSLRLDPRNLLAMRVRGPSMEPMMFEDDVIIIDTSDRKPIAREIYAVNFDGEACIKQLMNRGGQWYLNSLNPDFGPINVRSGQCSIVGRVVYQPGRVVAGRL
jgi:hypothetical protein